MLQVKTPVDAIKIIKESFKGSISATEILPLHACMGRVLACDIHADQNVPNFNRSSVDGYAVRAADTFGCSDSMSAIVKLRGVVNMGEGAMFSIAPGECAYVPTGGAIPDGADAVVMLEYTESYGGGEIGILKPAAPGNNMVYIGDDVFPGKTVLKRGRVVRPEDIGALAALGICEVSVVRKPVVGILSTGDELVEVSETPSAGQVRDVNSSMLYAAVQSFGGEPVCLGIVRDGYVRLRNALNAALESCDMVLISGGSSVGQMDSTCAVIDERGKLLLHGIAMKPGKPTIVGNVDGKPVFGLPGHPLAAHFVAKVFVKPLIEQMLCCSTRNCSVKAVLTEAVSANHGREQYSGAILFDKDGVTYVEPVHSKSGLISTLAGCDGYFVVPRDCEGYAKGTEIEVII
ncbi:MAG: molybdopterin molybdotransferase MoeA [Bacillota bacterium]|nr:molybdopterin molybdotransferase MoeA [Bacillota bacterium]